MLRSNSRGVRLTFICISLLAVPLGINDAHAQASCSSSSGNEGLNKSFGSRAGDWQVQAKGDFACSSGVHADVTATRAIDGDNPPSQPRRTDTSPPKQQGSSSITTTAIFCSRDDYMFLPAGSAAGLPCITVPSNQHFDPYPLAVQLAATLPPPDLHIHMNPKKGMVAVPTWFWVEGYDGRSMSASQTEVEQDTTCHDVALRGADNLPLLDASGRPRARTDCTTESTTFVVEARLTPNDFAWDFGDHHGQHIACTTEGSCHGALGTPFIDAGHESPIQHPYVWSSLGVNGAADAYTVQLAITFGADYRVSVNGQDQGGWHSLSPRALSWTANHQVQEAQAVLTKP